jgi:biotin synthase-like enzyme
MPHDPARPAPNPQARTDWTREEIAALFDLPFTELVFRAAEVHRAAHKADEVQLSTLLSIKTGGCVEDCGYCSQSVSANSGVKATKLMEVQTVLQRAAQAAASPNSCRCRSSTPKPRCSSRVPPGAGRRSVKSCSSMPSLGWCSAR